MTERIRGQVEHLRDIIGLCDDQAERVIRDDHIDILVDLRGHAAVNRMRLFARKPAPVQVNMVGYFDTTGLSAMDYRITDASQDPPGVANNITANNFCACPRAAGALRQTTRRRRRSRRLHWSTTASSLWAR